MLHLGLTLARMTLQRHHPGLSEIEDPFMTAEIEVCKLKETQRVKAEKLQRFQVAVRHRLLASVHEQAELRKVPQEHVSHSSKRLCGRVSECLSSSCPFGNSHRGFVHRTPAFI
jgi:hypothetical protein